ncbi:MAG: GDP-mannose 4,6-dehydratase [Candidatus Altiarchaeota archaeon]
MKILVTGGAGFIGSHVCEFYANSNKENEIICYDNLSRGTLLRKKISQRYNLNFLKNFSNVKFVRGDIRKFENLKKVMKDAELVIHAAAQTAVTSSVENPRTDFEINALGTFNVLEAARLSNNDPVVIYCSTNKVYGENVNSIKVNELEKRYEFSDKNFSEGIPENFPIDAKGHSPYGVSKLAGDQYCRDYFEVYGLKTLVFRMSCIYGTRQFGVEDQGWIAHFIISSIFERPLTIYGNGKQVRDVLYVTDLVEAFHLGYENINKFSGEVYNIGGGKTNTLSILELIEILREYNLNPNYKFSSWRPSDQKVFISDISKAKKELSWKPKISAKRGIKFLFEWVKENKNVF